MLAKHKTSPTISIAEFEVAGVEREGQVSDKFAAIENYTGAFVLTRALVVLGGYPTQGWTH